MSVKHKTFFRLFLICALLYSFAFMVLSYVVDPLQFYRKAWYTPVFSEEERYQNPGLAKNYEYDTIIIGSSMTQNFVPSHVEAKLGGRVMKLSIEGSTSREQRLIAETALRTGRVQRVIWGLDYFAMRGEADMVRGDQGPFPYYLYDDNPLNDVRYLYNFSAIRQVAEGIFDGMIGEKKDTLETLNNWNDAAEYGEEETYANYLVARGMESGLEESEVPLATVQTTFEENVLSLIAAHPEVEWLIYYPPYSVLRHHVWYELNRERFDNQQEMKEWMFEKLSALPNVSIHDFQAAEEITFNLDNYKDISHHSQAVNDWIIGELAKMDYIVTADNVAEFNEKLLRQVSELDPYRLDPNRILVTLKGRELAVMPHPRMTENGVIMAPVSGVLDQAGAVVQWDQSTGKMALTYGKTAIELTLGSREAVVGGGVKELDAAPEIVGGRVQIPLVAVSSALGISAHWDERSRTYHIE